MDGGQPTGADPCSWPRVDPHSHPTLSPHFPTAHPPRSTPFNGRCGAGSASVLGGRVVVVAESILDPPGPIPNPVVTQESAGEYCGGDPVGGEAAATTTRPHIICVLVPPFPSDAGWSSGSSLGS